jgi:hypothetical protein
VVQVGRKTGQGLEKSGSGVYIACPAAQPAPTLADKMPYISATYQRTGPTGPSGLLRALQKLLGETLIHWSIAEHPSGTTEALLHTTVQPNTLAVGGMTPVFAVCEESVFYLHAIIQVNACQKLPAHQVEPRLSALQLAESLLATARARFDEEEQYQRLLSAPVKFKRAADTLAGPYEGSVYITLSPSTTHETSPCTVELINRYYKNLHLKGSPRRTRTRRTAHCINVIDVPVEWWFLLNDWVLKDDIKHGGRLFAHLDALYRENHPDWRASPPRASPQRKHARRQLPGPTIERHTLRFWLTADGSIPEI